MKTITHTATGSNFHGDWQIILRGPSNGFYLSESQKRKYLSAICPFDDCTCGGGYGDGADKNGATIEEIDYDKFWLEPRQGKE